MYMFSNLIWEQVEKSDLSLFELELILWSQKIQKLFSITRIFFLTVGQSNFKNKIPSLCQIGYCFNKYASEMIDKQVLFWNSFIIFI